jgi:hypothetical protein
MKHGDATGLQAYRQTAYRWVRRWLAAGDHPWRIGLIAISVIIGIVIVFALFGMEWITQYRRDWVTLGNTSQAYSGVSALISAIALVGVVGSLLIQARQHSLDRSTSIRGRQAQIYAIVREDPELYWPVLGGAPDNKRSIRRRTVMIEVLHYCLAGYETGLISEECLRNEIFPGFFSYEENRDYWVSIPHVLLEDSSSKKVRRFAKIANEELQRARATGPGLTVPLPSDHTPRMRSDREPHWHLPVLVMTAAAGLGFLLSSYRIYPKDRTLCPSRYGVV